MSNKKISKVIDIFKDFLSMKNRDKKRKIDDLEVVIKKLNKLKKSLKDELKESKKSSRDELSLRLSIVKKELKNAKKLLKSLED
jgi:DNA-binding transcriptional regulator GbsR (MarR family)